MLIATIMLAIRVAGVATEPTVSREPEPQAIMRFADTAYPGWRLDARAGTGRASSFAAARHIVDNTHSITRGNTVPK